MTDSSQPETIVLLGMWIPAGKDEFGFKEFENAPLKETGRYRKKTELTISDRLAQKFEDLKDKRQRLAGMKILSSLDPEDSVLGLRAVAYRFTYDLGDRGKYLTGDLPGSAMVLSNGLYLWRFAFPHEDNNELRTAVQTFLENDFFPNHIGTTFDFKWPASNPPHLSEYAGMLTFYQLDLIFNGLFDSSAYPHRFLAQESAGYAPPSSSLEAGVEYSVDNLLKSLCIYAVGNSYLPLFDRRKDFSYSGIKSKNAETYINSAAELVDVPATVQVERLVSRMTYACMEQFLRVTSSFAGLHYRAGLDFCRAQLTNDSLARISRTSGEMLRPSLLSRDVSLAEIESYATLMSGKTPSFELLRDLVEDLMEVSNPLGDREIAQDGETGRDEWLYSKATLQEALAQYDRQISAIQADIQSIDRNLQTLRSEQMIEELAETRKITEIESESPANVVVMQQPATRLVTRPNETLNTVDHSLIARFTLLAAILAGVQIYSGIGVWVMERLTSTDGFSQPEVPLWSKLLVPIHWAIVTIVILVIYKVFRNRTNRLRPLDATSTPTQPEQSGTEPVQSHIFDYSFLRERLIGADGQRNSAIDIVPAIARQMPPLYGVESSACTNISSFRETPSSGVERTKYSLDSPTYDNGASYVLHIEVDKRLKSEEEYLRDVRLVIRAPSSTAMSITMLDIQEAAKGVIIDAVNRLALSGKPAREKSEFYASRFGWKVTSDGTS